jgi:hypothetical protein
MPEWTRTAAFRFYDTEPRNPNWSWSARSADGATVAITLWKDEFIGSAGKMTYAKSELGDWFEGPGSRFFFEDLAWAKNNCDGIVRVIVAVRDEQDKTKVSMAECYPQKNLVMRITHLDAEAGAFGLSQIVPNGVVPDRASVVKRGADTRP